MSTHVFKPDDLVWVKIKSFPWWPGQIADPAKVNQNIRHGQKKSLLVYCFGDRVFAWFENKPKYVLPFRKYRDEFFKQPNKLILFQKALAEVVEMEADLSSEGEEEEDADSHHDNCETCGKDTGKLILCATCERVYHAKCLSPPVYSATVLPDDWRCPVCSPKKVAGKKQQTTKSQIKPAKTITKSKPSAKPRPLDLSKRRKKTLGAKKSDNEISDGQNHDYCDVCSRKSGVLICCDGCPYAVHERCLPCLHDIDADAWFCEHCVKHRQTREINTAPAEPSQTPSTMGSPSETKTQPTHEHSDGEDSNDDLCNVCASDGELLCCGLCRCAVHLQCHAPPLEARHVAMLEASGHEYFCAAHATEHAAALKCFGFVS